MFMPMDPLDYLTDEELLQFFRSKRTEMSVLNPPYTFLNQLRDDNIIPEDQYKKVIKMKSKGQREMGMYKLLDWLETERPQNIKLFWRCVFKDHLLKQYPTLCLFRNSLLDGSSKNYNLPVKVEEPEVEVVETKVKVEAVKYNKRKAPEEGEEGEKTGREKKQKEMCGSIEYELPGPSSRSTQTQKPIYTSAQKKEDIWNRPMYKTQLPVTCGNLKGTLNRNKITRGEPCILVNGEWVIPSTFEKLSKGTSKDWKMSILCQDTPLSKLIKEGHLICLGFKNRMTIQSGQINAVFPNNMLDNSVTEYEVKEEEEEQEEEEEERLGRAEVEVELEAEEEDYVRGPTLKPEKKKQKKKDKPQLQYYDRGSNQKEGIWNLPEYKTHLPVTSGTLKSILNRDKMAVGDPCILFNGRWVTPPVFEKQGTQNSHGKWKENVFCQDTPLGNLVKKGHLICPGFQKKMSVHSGQIRAVFPYNTLEKSLPEPEEEEQEEKEAEVLKDEEEFLPIYENQFPITCGNLKDTQNGDRDSTLQPEKEDIWNLPQYKTELPVTCGKLMGMLNRDKMALGKPCILVNKEWVTAPVFEKQGTQNGHGKWKENVFCQDTPLGKLLKEGHLICPGFLRKKSIHSGQINSLLAYKALEKSVPEEKEEEKEEEDDILSVRVEKSNYTVTCGSLTGTLHNYRFASGTRGKSIRTESSWVTPAEFMNVGMAVSGGSWIKDIQWEGKPLSYLIKEGVLTHHQVQCRCRLCSQDTRCQQEQNNDDECFTCRAQGSLVLCEQCPRSFHQTCHLPHVDDAILGVESPWLCTFCILKATQNWLYPSQKDLQAVISYPVTDHLLECHYLLLFIYNADKDQIFANDPCCLLSRDKNVIKIPMWLDMIAEKLQNNLYQTMAPFLSDFRLIFDNCARFNKDNAEIRNIGARMKDLFQREFMRIFNIKF